MYTHIHTFDILIFDITIKLDLYENMYNIRERFTRIRNY